MSLPEEYKLAIDRQEQESSRYWARSNMMILVQGIMLSLFSSVLKYSSSISLVLSIQGFILSLAWLGILIKGRRYVCRWDEVIKYIENKSDQIKYPIVRIYSVAREKEKNKYKLKLNSSTTTLMEIAVISTLILWLPMIALASKKFYHSHFGEMCVKSTRQHKLTK